MALLSSRTARSALWGGGGGGTELLLTAKSAVWGGEGVLSCY